MSKSRGPTKAEQILAAAQARCISAVAELGIAQDAVRIAQAKADAHREAYQALERSLAAPPRKKRTPKPGPAEKTRQFEGIHLSPPAAEANGASLTPEMIEGEKKKNRAPKAAHETTPASLIN